ncbi:phage/plasmid primase, P4 family [Allokutzneria sp. A3M-2-11 16]|uniref:phage/plasmid primase, P4 family n=1 Tax=Allokutzneria sp. A3M-2-11 16 TaxID=2962043 RepID=UPI0020B8178E|nr:phage/plasmid primase, P4 family [Allokutzneria sp. A3M-2-11 16]MCP3800212.1 phage/plasmid primase, P4 family [Allokutzneria sp. A3M-2-11 16]
MHIDRLLGRLGRGTVADEPGGVLVHCPAHEDGRPSLYVSLTPDRRALLYCRAGCATADVLRAVDLDASALFDVDGVATVTGTEPTDVDPAAVAALAVYVTAATNTYANSDAQTYVQRRFGVTADIARQLRLGFDDGTVSVGRARDYRTTGYAAHPRLVVPFADWDGVTRGLQGRDLSGACPARWLNLASPKGMRWSGVGVFRVADSFPTVLVTEGPGDALTAVAAGYTAVAVRGSGVARAQRTAQEIAARADAGEVVLVGDNDQAGTAFVDALAANLASLGITARVLAVPPEHEDLTAWRETAPQGFPRALHEAVADAAPWTPTTTKSTPTTTRGEGKSMQGTDIANARLALRIVGEDTAHVDGVGFLTWDGRVWRVMSTTRERAIGHRVADTMRTELAAMPRGDRKGSRDEQEQAREYADAVKRTRRMHMDAGIRAALEHLRTITAADVAEFDATRHLLTVANGTIDLRAGELREHRREDRLTRLVELDFDPDAHCPRWTAFLEEVFPDEPEMPAFMRRLIGYGITGETREHAFALLYGHGSNGKSVFVNTVAEVFAGITGHLSQAAIAYTRSFDPGAPNPALAALRGVRLAVLSELSDGLRLNEALLKQITAGDPVVARELYRGQFVFTPQALLVLATNYKPDVRGQDDGFWRRTRLIPFSREFTAAQRDSGLAGRLLAEAPGILAWAVRGAVEWYTDGLAEPASVRAAVAEYRRASDSLDGFLPGVLVRDPDAEIPLDQAFTAYLDWIDVEQGGQTRPWGKITFRRNLESRKVGVTRRARGVVLRGVRKARPNELT